MKNKKGFTLAEVLITLGIVGVVAALTAPGLILSSRNEANAAGLSVMMGNVENALTTAAAAEGAGDLIKTAMWGASDNELIGELGKYMHITGAATGQSYVKLVDGTAYPSITSGATAISTKNGAIIYIKVEIEDDLDDSEKQAIIKDGGSLTKSVGSVAIDVNGPKEPNRWGRDVFAFTIGDDGTLYPYGGTDMVTYASQLGGTGWYLANDRTCDISSNNSTGLGCTNRVIENGFKFDY